MTSNNKEVELTALYTDDAEALAAIANNYNVARYLRDNFPFPYTIDHARDFIKLMNDGNVQSVFAVRYQGEIAGVAGVNLLSGVERKTCEMGFWLGEPFWGKGIASEVCRQLTHFAFTYYDIVRITAQVAAPNKSSSRVLRKNGFRKEACLRKAFHKDGHDYDLLIYGLLKEETV